MLRHARRLRDLRHHRAVVGSIVRVVVVTTLVVTLYVLAPLERPIENDVVIKLVVVFCLYAAIVVVQILAVARSEYPRIRAIEAVVVTLPLLIVLFAAVYVVTYNTDHGSFTEPIDHTGGIYFTVTVLATVGFGDIAAVSHLARMIVTLQMIIDLLFIGVVFRVLTGAVQRRRAVLEQASSETVTEARAEDLDPS